MAIKLSGLASGLDTDAIITELMKAQRMKSTKIENSKVKLEWKQEKWQELNKKLYSFYTGTLSSMRLQGGYNVRSAASSDESKVKVTAGNGAVEGNHQIKIDRLATAQYVTGGELKGMKDGKPFEVTGKTTMAELGVIDGDEGEFRINNKPIKVTKDTTLNELVNKLKSAGINASFDNAQKRLFLSSKTSGSDGAFTLTTEAAGVKLDKLGLGTVIKDGDTFKIDGSAPAGAGMALVAAEDAEFEYNGAKMKSSSNTVTVNGLTFELLGQTGTGTVSINVKKDTQAVYDKIKSMVKEYNEILTTMNELYNAPSVKGYEPLTDEQKEAMSEKEIEKWEAKIKDSLLRRDDGIGSLINRMRSDINFSVEVNGKKYSLSSFGVKGMDYTEKGLLHIDGDKDDSTVSGNADELMKALEENPQAVISVFSKFADNMYSSYADSMGKSSSLRSTLTFYNDKEMKKQVEDYGNKLKALEKKLTEIEDRYYKQFSAMEKAMSSLNAQSNNLAAMLGTGQR
ncbi:flagellar hook-associated protein 2 [Anaerotaenia torta]|uniref:flagellar filament capping protein FliD n=1 Tax=Anaerotaenia torta TaxID=433293 RepID=UPI003D1F48A5